MRYSKRSTIALYISIINTILLIFILLYLNLVVK